MVLYYVWMLGIPLHVSMRLNNIVRGWWPPIWIWSIGRPAIPLLVRLNQSAKMEIFQQPFWRITNSPHFLVSELATYLLVVNHRLIIEFLDSLLSHEGIWSQFSWDLFFPVILLLIGLLIVFPHLQDYIYFHTIIVFSLYFIYINNILWIQSL